jgi:hypothetical protein
LAENLDGEQVEERGDVTPALERAAGPTEQGRTRPSISVPQALIVVGAIAIVVSMFLNWVDLSISVAGSSFSRSGTATYVPVQFLFDKYATDSDPTILVLLIPAAVFGLLGALTRQKAIAFIGGVVPLVVVGLFAYQVHGGIGDLNKAAHGAVHFGLNDVMGIAPYVCGGGAIVTLVGAAMLRGAPRKNDYGQKPADGASLDSDAA